MKEAQTNAENGSLFVHLEREEGIQKQPRLPRIVDEREYKVWAQETSVIPDERAKPTALLLWTLLFCFGQPARAAATFGTTASAATFVVAAAPFVVAAAPFVLTAPAASVEAAVGAKGRAPLSPFFRDLGRVAGKLVEGGLDVEVAKELLD
jgi:hypothetical protein